MFKWLKGIYPKQKNTRKDTVDLSRKNAAQLERFLLSTEFRSLQRISSLGTRAHGRVCNHIATLLRGSTPEELSSLSGNHEHYLSSIILALAKGYDKQEIAYRLRISEKEIDRVASFFSREYASKETQASAHPDSEELRRRKKGVRAVQNILVDSYRFQHTPAGSARITPETEVKERQASINNSMNKLLRQKRNRSKMPLQVTLDIIPTESLSLVDIFSLVESVDYMFGVAKKFQTRGINYTFRIHEDFAFFKGENRADVRRRVREIEAFSDEFRELLRDVQGGRQKSAPKRSLGVRPPAIITANLEVLTDRKLRREKEARVLQALRRYAQEGKIAYTEDSTWQPVLYSEHSISAFSFIRGHEDMELKEEVPYVFNTIESTIALSQSTIEADVQISGTLCFSKEETYSQGKLLEGIRTPFLYRTKAQLYGLCGEKLNRPIVSAVEKETAITEELQQKNNVSLQELPLGNNLPQKLYALLSSDTFSQGFGIVDYWRLLEKDDVSIEKRN